MQITIPITIDLSVQHEAEFLDWYDNFPEKIKPTLLCGFFMVKHGLDVYNQNTVDSSWMEKYVNLEKNYKESLALIKEQYTNNNPLSSDLIYWRDKFDKINNEYKEFIKENSIQNLKIEYQRRQADAERKQAETERELNIFKNTNQYKGAIGEKTIKDILAKEFTNYEIKDTSGSASMSDIHLINKYGDIIAIECKNKAIITPQDIEKSLIDIKALKEKFQDKFQGYLFVSIRSKNIPKKGDLHYEIVESRPVIWYGMDGCDTAVDSADSIGTANSVELIHLIKVISAHKINTDTDIDQDIITDKLKSYIKKLSDNKKAVLLVHNNMESLKSNITIIQNNIDWIYQDIFNHLGITEIIETDDKEEHNCDKCSMSFKRKNELTRHYNKVHKMV
jgi:hypothetical protein